MSPIFQTIFVALVLPVHVWCYGNGKVEPACTSMEPQHGTTAQTTAPPFTITVDKTAYKSGESIGVTISSNSDGPAFEGFFLQARADSVKDIQQGTFLVCDSKVQALKCSATADAVSHTSSVAKMAIKVNWIAPKTDITNIQLRATIAKTERIYWMNVLGPKLVYNGTGTGTGTGTCPGSDGPMVKASVHSLLLTCGLLLLLTLFKGF